MACARFSRLLPRLAGTLAALLLAFAFVASAPAQTANTTIVLPSSISSIAGAAPAATTKGSACSTGSPYTATDTLGDGCPAAQAVFSTSDTRAGLVADPLGNVYFGDTGNQAIRKYDPRSGLVTLLVGLTPTVCSTAVDKYGDGCPIANAGNFNNPRGVGTDPYGNVFIAGYNDQLIHLVCTTVSPLCTAGQLGTMRAVAGCTTNSTTGAGTATGTAGSVAGDGTSGYVNGGCSGSSTTIVSLSAPRGVNADSWGNIYIGDTGSLRYRVVLGQASVTIAGQPVANPLFGIIAMTGSPYASKGAVAGNIYALIGGTQFTVPASGAACFSGSASNALDAYGDGCPFFNSLMYTSGGFVQGIEPDLWGNVIFQDGDGGTGHLRVLYAGAITVNGVLNPMAAAITANNPTIASPIAGYTYLLAGGGGTGLSATPSLGTSTAGLDGSMYRTVSDTNGNIYIGDNTQVLFFDVHTGYLRKLLASSGSGATLFGGSNSVLGVGLDNLGNLYLGDGAHEQIKKVSAASYGAQTVGTAGSASLVVHTPSGTTAVTPAAALDPEFALGTPTTATNADGTVDYTYPVTIAPAGNGLRSDTLAITTTPATNTIQTALSAPAAGTSLVFDISAPAGSTSTSIVASSIKPASGAFDGNAYAYAYDTLTGNLVRVTLSGNTSTIATLASAPSQIAVDALGNVYAAFASTATVQKFVPAPVAGTSGVSYTATSFTIPGITGLSAIAVDANGNVYTADTATKLIGRYSQATGISQSITPSALNTPVGLALDNLGNVLVADSGAGAVYKVPTNGIAAGLPPTVAISGSITPKAVAADAAGNVYVADAASKTVLMVATTGTQTTVATGFTSTISGLAVDPAGNVYVADPASFGVTKVNRSAYTYAFGTDKTTIVTGTLTNAGTLASTGFQQSDAADFVIGGSGATCNPATTTLASGAACTVATQFSGTSGGNISNVVQLKPTASTVGSLTFTGTASGAAYNTTTTIGGQTPASVTYAPTGTEVTLTVTVAPVAPATQTPTGNVNVQIDGGAAISYPLGSAGSVAISFSGLTAGAHTIAASYPNTGAFVNSTATPYMLTIAQATTSLTWTPGSTTQQVSAALGTSVLNAASNGVPGAYVYTATPTGGTAIQVNAATYLPIGIYSLAVSFTPTDAVDYTSAIGSVASYSVTKATATAAVGATQMLVAGDSTGNFTTVQSAVNALPTTGGSIYIKPGSYNGFITIVTPNVALRGLGGDPTKVILTHSAGAFGSTYPYTGEFTAANSNGAQNPSGSLVSTGDPGSATLYVAKGNIVGVNNNATTVPNNFVAEDLTVLNTYNTDTVTTTTTYETTANGTCVTNAGQAMTYAALYNAGTLCASQALAVWNESDGSILNNVNFGSLQDTVYAGSQGCGSTCTVARQYYWRGMITGDVDYIFGDAAAVFDGTQILTLWHGSTATGTETIEAQNKMFPTGGSGDYLSGYIYNNATLTSQGPGMTNLYYGRPYGPYSTNILLNTAVDQVNPLGWTEFSGRTNLPTSTYATYNVTPYSDAAGNTGQGVNGALETTSIQPTTLTAAQAAKYFPTAFLNQTVTTASLSAGQPTNWNPTTALASEANAFVPSASGLTIASGQSVTILTRPQTPGAGMVPTGTYTLVDNGAILASGSLDAMGEAYYTSSNFAPGQHSLTTTYSGDANFTGYSSSSVFKLTVSSTTAAATTTVVTPSPNPATYGQGVTVAATALASGSPVTTGTVRFTLDGVAVSGYQAVALNASGQALATITGAGAGAHTLAAYYSGNATYQVSGGTANETVNPAVLTVKADNVARAFESANLLTATITGYVNGDNASTAYTGSPALSTTATPNSPAGAYPITAAAGTLASSNYTFTFTAGTLTVNGGAAQTILFLQPPAIPHGVTAPLFGRSTSGLPITYTIMAGSATINTTASGSTITVTAAGPVTVVASQPGNGTFAAATQVSRSFTAQ